MKFRFPRLQRLSPRVAGMSALASSSRIALVLALLLGIWLPPLAAYYPFLHLKFEEGRWVSIPERFDLRKAPGGAVPVVVSRPAGIVWQDGDHWEALVSQVKLASAVWSEVSTSSLRLGYAGEVDVNVQSVSPHIQIVFDELPPGVIAMAGPVSFETQDRDQHGLFVPIAKSLVIHNADLSHRPTYGEAFFRTLVHEIGHAVGLQHTFTASVMSTGITRSTTKAAALAPDDEAGVSWLYPDTYFRAETGALRGRITIAGEPLHFASVVALSPSGVAVSSITLPDGSYEMQGLPHGHYYLYAQMIPPSSDPSLGPGQIVLPVDEHGRTLYPGSSFGTRFYPSAATWDDAFLIDVQPGSTLDGLNIDVPPQPPSRFHGVTTYSFFGQTVNQPAVLNSSDPDRFLVTYGPNLSDAPEGLDGLRVDALGAFVWEQSVKPYPFAPEFLQVGVQVSPFSFSGPKALLFRRDDDVYVQPAAFHLVGQVPPRVLDVAAQAGSAGGYLRVHGEELGVVAEYVVEGLRLSMHDVSTESGPAFDDPGNGLGPQPDRNTRAVLRQPYTGEGVEVAVVALARDRQSSLFASPDARRVSSRIAPHGGVRLSPQTLPAGAHAALTLESDEALFSGETLWVDFGSPSIVVTDVWKHSNHKLLLNVVVGETAAPGDYSLRLHNDLALRNPGASLQVAPARVSLLQAASPLLDVETESPWPRAGATAALVLPGLDAETPVEFLLEGRSIPVRWAQQDLLHVEMPADLGQTVVTWTVHASGMQSLPRAVRIHGEPARIVVASVSTNVERVAEGRPVSARIRASVQLPPEASHGDPKDLRLRVNGRHVVGVQLSAIGEAGSTLQLGVTARLPWNEAVGDEIRLQVEWKGRPSPVYPVRLSQLEPVNATATVAQQ